MRTLPLVVVVVSVVSSCAPRHGDKCDIPGGMECVGADIGMYCQSNNRFFELSCPGGCITRKDGLRVCSFVGATEGQWCPPDSWFGHLGHCASSVSLIECNSEKWVARTCSSCTTKLDARGLEAATCTP